MLLSFLSVNPVSPRISSGLNYLIAKYAEDEKDPTKIDQKISAAATLAHEFFDRSSTGFENVMLYVTLLVVSILTMRDLIVQEHMQVLNITLKLFKTFFISGLIISNIIQFFYDISILSAIKLNAFNNLNAD